MYTLSHYFHSTCKSLKVLISSYAVVWLQFILMWAFKFYSHYHIFEFFFLRDKWGFVFKNVFKLNLHFSISLHALSGNLFASINQIIFDVCLIQAVDCNLVHHTF